MTVEPGFGGQAFMHATMPKLRLLLADRRSAAAMSGCRSTAASTSARSRSPPRPAPTRSSPARRVPPDPDDDPCDAATSPPATPVAHPRRIQRHGITAEAGLAMPDANQHDQAGDRVLRRGTRLPSWSSPTSTWATAPRRRPARPCDVHYVGVDLGDRRGVRLAPGAAASRSTFPLDSLISRLAAGHPRHEVGGRRQLIVPPALAYGPIGGGHRLSGRILVIVIDLLGR